MKKEDSFYIFEELCKLVKDGGILSMFIVNCEIGISWCKELDVPVCYYDSVLIDLDKLELLKELLNHFDVPNCEIFKDELILIFKSIIDRKIDDELTFNQKVKDYITNKIEEINQKESDFIISPLKNTTIEDKQRSNKIDRNTIKRINFGFPSEFTAKTESNDDVYIHFRFGDVTIKVNDVQIVHEPLEPYGHNGFLSDENLEKILKRNNL
jgi:hypothetical protein